MGGRQIGAGRELDMSNPAPEGGDLLSIAQNIGPEPDENPKRFCGGPEHLLGAGHCQEDEQLL